MNLTQYFKQIEHQQTAAEASELVATDESAHIFTSSDSPKMQELRRRFEIPQPLPTPPKTR